MRLKGKLGHWEKQGLISTEQHNAILEYERQHGFSFQAGLAFVGVFAIAVGILSIIAANWQLIPGWLKLGVHLLLNGLLAAGVLRTWRNPLIGQLCLVAWYGLALTFIGLMGQVFHLAGSLAGALVLWTLLTSAAVVAFATNALVLLVWIVGTLITLIAGYGAFVRPRLGTDLLLPWLALGAMLPAALAMIAARLKAARWHVLNTQLLWLAGLLPVVTAAIVSQFWYSDRLRAAVFTSNDVVATLAVAALAIALASNSRLAVPDWLGSAQHDTQHSTQHPARHFRLLLLVACMLITLPFLFPRIEANWLAALSFIVLWLVLGWLAHGTQNPRLVSMAIFAIALRIFIIYIEVFGTLLQTGIGLIFSGVVLLLLVQLARRLSRRATRAAASPDGGL
jgi:uncharacterized membrane protein